MFVTPEHRIRRMRSPSPATPPGASSIAAGPAPDIGRPSTAAAGRKGRPSVAAAGPAGDSDIDRPSADAGQLVPAARKAFDSISPREAEVVPVDLCPSDEDSAAKEALKKKRKQRNEAERRKKDGKKKGGREQLVRPRLPIQVWRRMVERDQKYEELEKEVLSWRAKGPKLQKLESHNKILTQTVATLEQQLCQCSR